MKQKQEYHENLAYPKVERIENNQIGITKNLENIELVEDVNRSQSEQLKKLTAKLTNLGKRLNDRIKEKVNASRDSQTSFKEESIRKSYFVSYMIK